MLKILLMGEYSGFHTNLKIGLEELGHQVTLASGGDGFKEIYGDIRLPIINEQSFFNKIKYRFKNYQLTKQLSGFDIVQLINPKVIPIKWYPYKKALKTLMNNNGKVFLLATGSDAYFWTYARKKMRYSPFEDILKYDLNENKSKYTSKKYLKHNTSIADKVHGIIPSLYEYQIAYEGHSKLRGAIPIPFDHRKIVYKENKINNKINVFHGLNRYGFKGTKHVEKAFKKLNEEFEQKIELRIDGKLPLQKYLQLMRESNIVIDQVNTYSYGMNALYAMAMGKVVMGGAEPECLETLGVDSIPIINVLPDSDDIYEKILHLINSPSLVEELSHESRKFVENMHDCRKIAKRYVEIWSEENL